jgi:hypothetical protein
VFIDLCKNGKLKEAHQLFLSNDIDIFRKYHYIFSNLCYDKYLDIAKWLLSIDNRPISSIISCDHPVVHRDVTIRDHLQWVFGECCRCGEVKIAKWLHSLGYIDVHAYNDDAFKWSCHKRQIESIKFLLSVDNKYECWYESIYNTGVVKLLFYHNLRSAHDFIKLGDRVVEKYRKLRESMMSALTKHLIPDIADLIYYYV